MVNMDNQVKSGATPMAALLQRTIDTITRNQSELLSSWKSDLQNLGGYHNVKSKN